MSDALLSARRRRSVSSKPAAVHGDEALVEDPHRGDGVERPGAVAARQSSTW